MQRLLEAQKSNITSSTEQKPESDIPRYPKLEPESKHEGLTTQEQTENKRIPVPEHV